MAKDKSYLENLVKNCLIGVSDSRVDTSANSESKWNIFISKCKLGCFQSETNQILEIEGVAIVSLFAKHFTFFSESPGITLYVSNLVPGVLNGVELELV